MIELPKKKINYVALGTILGDSHSVTKTQFCFNHSIKQKEYAEWKRELFSSFGCKTSDIHEYMYETNYGMSHFFRCYFALPSKKGIQHIYKTETNTKWKNKIVKKSAIKLLHPLGLLLWWFDDGCLSVSKKENGSICRQGSLAIHSFDFQSQENIVKGLKEFWNIETKLHKDKHLKRLYFSATSLRVLFDIFRPYTDFIPDCMKYKICMRYETNRLRDSNRLCENYNLCGFSAKDGVCPCLNLNNNSSQNDL